MKKSIIKYISLGISCLMGVGALIGFANIKSEEPMSVHAVEHTHEGWTAWSDSTSLPSSAGSYYLTTDVTLTNKTWKVPGVVNLCLNDHIITITGPEWSRCINLAYSTNPMTLNLYDEPHTTRYWINDSTSDYRLHGKIVSQSEYNSYTGYKGTFVGGAITSNIIDTSQRTLKVESSNIFNMYGGNIVGSYGHAIEAVSTSNITINGGKITGSSIAIYSDTSGNVTINGGEISGNHNGIRSTNPAGPINLNGGKISDTNSVPYSSEAVQGCIINYNGTELLNNKCDFNVGINSNTGYLKLEKPLPENSTYKIICREDGVFTENWSTYMGEADPTDYFVCYYENKAVERDGDEAAYRTTYTITYDGNGATSGTVPDPEAYISGKTATISGNTGNLEKTDLFFAGWNTKADGTGDSYNAGSSMTVTANATLFAKWRGAPYTITFNNNGGEGPESVIAYYDDDMPEITLPTKTHHTFTGYWDSEDESGTKYYNADGSSAHVWDKEADTILYAHYEASMSVLDVGTTEYTWDGDFHSYEYIKFKDDATEDEITDYTIKFSTDEGTTYTLDTKPEFSAPGVYKIYYEVNKTGYANLYGEVTVTINKADASMTPPDAREELVYDGNPKYLTTKGYTDDGTIMYNIDGGEWQSERPEVTNAGTYTVGYKVIGDINHNDTEPQYVSVTIAKADYETSVSLSSWSYGETPNSPSVSNNPENGTVTYEYKEKSAAEETYSTTVPTNAGEYTVRATIAATTNYNQEVATTDFTISKVAPTQVDPIAKTDLVYTGSAQDLINAGSSTGGIMKYKLGDNGVYNEDIPSAINVGDYTVYYKVFGDSNHEDSAEQSLVVNIAKAQAVLTAPTGKSGLNYTGEDQVLINAGSSTAGEVLYKVNDGEYSTSLPVGKNVGNYTVYYKVESTDNYDGVAEANITVSIEENNKDALVNAINNADSYLDTITEKYPEIASTLKTVRDEAYNDFYLEKNVTESQVSEEIAKLEEALKNAKVDIVEILINNIGTVTFPDSKETIKEARDTYDALDDELKPLVENYATLTTAETTYETLASKRNDEASGVSIETNDGTAMDENINLIVEIRTSVKAQEGSTEYNNIQSKLAADEVISNVYDIKLVKNEGGVETIIQPSEIKEGMKIIVHIKLPTGLDVSGLKLLHIHGENDINFVEDFEIKNGEIVFEADRFSEIAFVKKSGAPAPQPDPSNSDNKISGWLIFAMIIGGFLALVLLFFLFFAGVIRRKEDEEERYY